MTAQIISFPKPHARIGTPIANRSKNIAFYAQKGISMAPTINCGELVAIDTAVTMFNGPGIYLTAFRDNAIGPPQIRRLDYLHGELHSISDNKMFPPFPVSLDMLLIGGKALDIRP